MPVNLTKPSLRAHEFTPIHIADETPIIQTAPKEINDSPKATPKIYNCKIPNKFKRSVKKTERCIRNSMSNDVIIRSFWPHTIICMLVCAICCFIIPSCPKSVSAGLLLCGSTLLSYRLWIKALDSINSKSETKFQFFRFEGTFDELKAHLIQDYPKCELTPMTTVLRYPKRYERNNNINQHYMQSIYCFLVAIDNTGHAYADAAAPYEDDLTMFYNTHRN